MGPACTQSGPRPFRALGVGRVASRSSHWLLLKHSRRRRLVEICSPAPALLTLARRVIPGWVGDLPQQTVQCQRWPAARRGPRGCQAGGRAPSAQSGFVGPRQGLAGGQAASGKSRERGVGEENAGRRPLLRPGSGYLPQPRADQHFSPGTCTSPTPFLPPNPHPSLHPIPLISQSLGASPTSRLPLFPFWSSAYTPAPLTLTHPALFLGPHPSPSSTSPILGSFPRATLAVADSARGGWVGVYVESG